MTAPFSDLTIDEVVTDPLIAAVMQADGIDRTAFRDLLERARDGRHRRGRCLGAFALPRSDRPWAGLRLPRATRNDCGMPRAW